LIPGIGPGGAYNYYVGSENAPVATAPIGNYEYGCNSSGQCVQIPWDPKKGNWSCSPNFSASDCGASTGKGCAVWPICD
jgi:hypothetical protein